MFLCRSLLAAASTLALLSRASAYIVTTEKWEPDALLVPGKTLFYNVVVEAKDTVVLVDVILANGILGNTSDIFADSDLRKKDDANAGFTVPFVPPGKQYTVRLVETATKKFLADSPQFEIFALNGSTSVSASSLPATSLPPISKTASPNSASPSVGSSIIITGPSPSAAGPNNSSSSAIDAVPVTGDPEPKSKTPVGAIAGGVVGGLLLIGLVVFFLLWRRRRQHRYGSAPATTLGGTDNEKATHGHGLASPGPHAVEPYTLPPSAVRPGAAGLDSTASLTGTGTDGGGAGPLPSKLGYGFAGSSSQGGQSPVLSPGTTRVEQLRLERERINRELAALEQRSGSGSHTATATTGPSSSGYSGGGASSYMPPSSAASGSRGHQESALAAQLAVLQTQIRQLEERQQRRESDAPPMYDGPPAAAAAAVAPSSSGAAGSVSSEPQYPVDSKR